MATVSKESLAQFWSETLPKIPSTCFIPGNETEKKIFDLIEKSIENDGIVVHRTRSSVKKKPSIVPRQPPRSTRFHLSIDVLPADDEVPVVLERSLDQLISLLHHPEQVDQTFRSLVYPWLIDLSFQVTSDLFSILVELMNTFPHSFFRHCFLPWIQHKADVDGHFFTHLFEHLQRRADQNQLCIYLSEDQTRPWNRMELILISHWLERKDFFFSRELFQRLPGKCVQSADLFADCLIFAKVLHKVLIKSSEHEQMINDEQRSALRQAIALNTTILSDILMDLVE